MFLVFTGSTIIGVSCFILGLFIGYKSKKGDATMFSLIRRTFVEGTQIHLEERIARFNTIKRLVANFSDCFSVTKATRGRKNEWDIEGTNEEGVQQTLSIRQLG